ncbi:MAG: hypothetical protein WBP64_01610 [Nitrososphaeraceae archaeon]
MVNPLQQWIDSDGYRKGENIPPLKIMTKNEVMNDLLKLLDLVQKHADKEGCQHCLDLLESVFEH